MVYPLVAKIDDEDKVEDVITEPLFIYNQDDENP